eukprot:CAMPEP_0201490108 /NCGR_PEP_ID=MMETSP0151_2-20130828/25082_1 /ASSEMBLY_ACC=CAM_ASM_000257 /TAXON_ID=200890 /ORGANISM="Paramoeba atlantica, Strain 621/1 / CCAP 1560/9" /LENGTH=159 /DNA_ID=CAMNT_0047875931 /DNA_START=161 /DNA_END=640 /DNA_ORIENTATION=+
MANNFDPLFSVPGIPSEFQDKIIFSVLSPMLVVYIVYYILLDAFAGLLYAPILIGLWMSANYFYTTNEEAFFIALVVHICSWVSQFVGHGIFEGRSPALFDNLAQAFLQAPFFVWLEVLFKFGYRKELQARFAKDVDARIKKMDGGSGAGGKKKKAKGQ